MSTAKDSFVEVAAGATVFKEGDSGGDMFIIESGQIDIVRKARGDEPVATLGPGDFFGEMAILEDQPRFAGAVAKTNARLLRIERSAFADVLKQNVEIGVRIMRKLAARHRRAEQRAQEALTELARMKSAAPAAPPARDAAKPKADAKAEAPRAPPNVPRFLSGPGASNTFGQTLDMSKVSGWARRPGRRGISLLNRR